MEREAVSERRADYAANLLWSLTGAVFRAVGADFPVKSWADLMEPPKAEPGGDDIRAILISRWGGGG